MTTPNSNVVLIYRMGRLLPQTSVRLFCLPPAGGGASIFYPLMNLDSPGYSICPVCYPGREGRAKEPIPQSLEGLANQLTKELMPYMDQPFMILGYSMGALLGYEIINRLQSLQMTLPLAFLPLASRPPHQPLSEKLAHLDTTAFRKAVAKLGGLPQAIIEDEETMSLVEPLLRSDFRNCENYQRTKVEKLTCPIFVTASDSDTLLEVEDIKKWKDYADGSFDITILKNQPHILPAPILAHTITQLLHHVETLMPAN
ncbi:MAG: thioesterase domain-containing protein [Verrucomicrobiota bacterium]